MFDKDATTRRLTLRTHIMDIIDRRRETELDMGIGASVERQILSRELAELEDEPHLRPSIELLS